MQMITVIASLMIMLGYFLMLYAAVGFIQDKRFFSSAPKEVQALIPIREKERFRGAHIVGWMIMVLSFLLFIGAAFLQGWYGVINGYDFIHFFSCYLIMLYAMEIYDIIFFDWILLCNSNFYTHFYPEVKGALGPHLFGFDAETHILHFLEYIPVSALAAWICSLL